MTIRGEERRRRPRISTMILCDVRKGDGSSSLYRVRDLSEWGLRIASHGNDLREGEAVHIRLPGPDCWIRARVVWASRGIAGLYFAKAVDLPQVAGARRGVLDAA